jgi:glycerol-3-phosphate dehydrogenase (NAD(P)+)
MANHIINTTKVGVVGSGSFATAIVKMLLENCPMVHWMVRDEFTKGALEYRGRNPKYLRSVSFDTSKLSISTDINTLVAACDVVILATPSIYLADSFEQLTVDYQGKLFVSAIKGIVPSHNDIVANYLRDKFQIGFRNQGVISGPCHAEEVAMNKLSYLTISAVEQDDRDKLSQLLASDYIKITQSQDILGHEYSAVLKNIYAIGAGIFGGLAYGDNFQAVFASNAIREMALFLDAIYPENREINSSSYLGDLLVTAYSLFSRNRMLGGLIGKGYTVKSAMQSMSMVAEGYYATQGIYEIAQQKGLELPIVNSIYKILYLEENAEEVMRELTNRLN